MTAPVRARARAPVRGSAPASQTGGVDPATAFDLDAVTNAIERPNAARVGEVRCHLDALTKPQGSLGQLEALALRLARIYGDPPPAWRERVIYVLAADHGVAARGVSAYPAAVTAQMCRNFAAGGAAVCAIAQATRAEVVAVDIGVDADLRGVTPLVHRKIRRGTRDLSRQSAMTAREVREAITTGYELVTHRRPLPDIVGIGEMGIGNTTAASALTAALTGVDAAHVTGRGTGVDDAALAHKTLLVQRAVERLPNGASPLRILRAVGGFEIAGLVGVILGAAHRRRAVIVDGFITTAAALAAVRLCAAVRGYLFAAHRSVEPGHRVLLATLRLRPLLRLGLRLGEGTGAALALPILDAAAGILRDMATFERAGVSRREA